MFSTERRDVVTSLVAEGRRQHGAPVALQPTANDGCSRGGFTRARRPLDQAETPGRFKNRIGVSREDPVEENRIVVDIWDDIILYHI